MHGYCSWIQSNSFGAPCTTAVTGQVNYMMADNMFCRLSLLDCIMQIIYSLSAVAALIQNCRQYGPAQSNLILQQVPGYRLNASLTGTQIKGVPLTQTAKLCHLTRFYAIILHLPCCWTPEGTYQRERIRSSVRSQKQRQKRYTGFLAIVAACLCTWGLHSHGQILPCLHWNGCITGTRDLRGS